MLAEQAVAPLRRAVPARVQELCAKLDGAGFRAWLVGGCVRDTLLGAGAGPESASRTRAVGDWDLASDARPEQVMRVFRKVIPTGVQHGTVTVVLGGEHFEITTLRGEGAYSDGRHPDSVFFVDDLRQDLARRDFTINAMAYDVRADQLHDPFGGLEDLSKGLIRAVGDPLERFSEDGLRVLRCARFAAVLGMDVETGTRQAIRPSLDSFAQVAQERVKQEWYKALSGHRPSTFLALSRHEGLLGVTAPALFASSAPAAAPGHFDDFLSALDHSKVDPTRRLAMVCIKALALQQRGELTRQFGERLRLSKVESGRLRTLVAGGTSAEQDSEKHDTALRTWLASFERDRTEEVVDFVAELAELNMLPRSAAALAQRAAYELSQRHALSIKELDISGKDLIQLAHVPPGPRVGQVLRQLFDQVLQDPTSNERERLLELARDAATTTRAASKAPST